MPLSQLAWLHSANKTLLMRKLPLLLFFVATLLTGCSKDDPAEPEKPIDPIENPDDGGEGDDGGEEEEEEAFVLQPEDTRTYLVILRLQRKLLLYSTT